MRTDHQVPVPFVVSRDLAPARISAETAQWLIEALYEIDTAKEQIELRARTGFGEKV